MLTRRTISKARRVSALLVLITLFVPTLSVSAQRTASSAPKKAATACSGAWTGTVTYTRTQGNSDNKTVPRVSGRGEDKREWEMRYEYRAQVAVIDSPDRPGSSSGKAKVDHKMTSTEKNHATERNSCDRGKTWKEMTGTSISKTETSGSAGGVDANVHIGVNTDGTYSVSVAIPPIQGKTTGSQSSTYSGQCVPKEGKNLTMPPTDTSIDGNSLTSDGTHRINPSDPNRASGSYSRTYLGVTETITWSLQKCGAPLRITDLRFEHPKFPNFTDWTAINEQTGTIDGNLVKIKATVLNASPETKFADIKFKETYKGDKWDGSRPDAPLSDNVVSVRLEAGEQRDVDMVWDSSGYAWFDDGRPRLVQRIKAELEENGKKTDEMTKNLKVAPKPLVLVHGLWSNWRAWEAWQNILTTAHSYDWKAFPVGEKPEKGVMNTGGAFMSTDKTNSIGENARELEKYIRYAQEDRNAWHVDVVAHSMGGLISRYYIDQLMGPGLFNKESPDGRPQISHLVMLGTPNMGSPCADVMNVAFETLGKNVEAVRQLRQDYLEGFNRVHTQRKGVKFSVLAGNPLPVMCKQYVWNDGVVPVESAKWKIADNALSKSIHTELTGTSDFSSFVKPRLAIGPKGNHNPEAPAPPTGFARFGGQVSFVNALFGSGGSLLENMPDFAKAVKVAPKQTVDVEIPGDAAQNFGVTFMADSRMSATLLDASGATLGTNLAYTPAAAPWFRSIFVERPVAAGTRKLRLQNTSDFELEAIITTWKDAVR
jgi:pimeloyl-ACP methyl ester carboxylesterase